MEPIVLPDIEMIQAAAFDDSLELYQDNNCTLPVDLTGKIFAAEIRAQAKRSATLLATMALTVGTPATNGVLNRHIHAADTATMPTGTCYYDIVETSGERVVWFTGRGIVRSGVTA